VRAELLDCAPLEAELELELDPALELEFELDFEALELDFEADDELEDDDELGVDAAGGVGGVGIDGGVGGLVAQPVTRKATERRISAPRMRSGSLGTEVGASQEMVQLSRQSDAGRVLDRGHERQRDNGAHDH
jgi:hypothetical protein